MISQEQREAAHATARERARDARYGIGACYVREVGEPGTDGWRGSVAVSDGEQRHEMMVAIYSKPGVGYRTPMREDVIARMVEELAGNFPADNRIEAMRDATSGGPGLRLDQWFPERWMDALAEPAP